MYFSTKLFFILFVIIDGDIYKLTLVLHEYSSKTNECYKDISTCSVSVKIIAGIFRCFTAKPWTWRLAIHSPKWSMLHCTTITSLHFPVHFGIKFFWILCIFCLDNQLLISISGGCSLTWCIQIIEMSIISIATVVVLIYSSCL